MVIAGLGAQLSLGQHSKAPRKAVPQHLVRPQLGPFLSPSIQTCSHRLSRAWQNRKLFPVSICLLVQDQKGKQRPDALTAMDF